MTRMLLITAVALVVLIGFAACRDAEVAALDDAVICSLDGKAFIVGTNYGRGSNGLRRSATADGLCACLKRKE